MPGLFNNVEIFLSTTNHVYSCFAKRLIYVGKLGYLCVNEVLEFSAIPLISL